jgi:lysozyme
MTTNGIDVSHYQGNIDWAKVRADKKSYKFAIMKVTENNNYYDVTSVPNSKNSEENGFLVSYYHFWRALSRGKVQASYMLSKLPKMPKLPLVIDVEDSTNVPPDPSTEFARACLGNIREMALELERVQGRRPIIYTGAWFWNRIANNYSIREADGTYWWSKYDLWVASYTTTPIIPWGWEKWLFWQYTAKGIVDGINANCDLDYFNGDDIALINYVNSGVTPTPIPPPPTDNITVSKKNLEATTLLANQVASNLKGMTGG